MPRLEVLVGMIASGKSTYACLRADQGALVVCHDDLTQMLHARYRYEAELREYYRRMEEALVGVGLLAQRDVVIDRTHLTRESRARWINFLQHFNDVVSIVAVEFPRESINAHATRRFNADPRGRPFTEWHAVARHHAAQADAEPLLVEEGFAAILKVGDLSTHEPDERRPPECPVFRDA